MPLDLVLIGAGGHAKSLLSIISRDSGVNILGIIDRDPKKSGSHSFDLRILGDDSSLPNYKGVSFVIGIGSTGDNSARQKLYRQCLDCGLVPFSVVSEESIIAPDVKIGRGAQIMPGSIVGAGAEIGENSIINSGAIVEHDCVLGRHVHIASGACLAGGVIVGDESFVGCGATVIQSIRIGQNSVIGAGAVVINNVPDGTRVAGNPAKPLG